MEGKWSRIATKKWRSQGKVTTKWSFPQNSEEREKISGGKVTRATRKWRRENTYRFDQKSEENN